ncbi:hypothetical protein Anas_12989 [Armadillidium nasatum]|uniref:Uncharacterized protein n=1 Tax=Armadillidium nasatum TaxID=96803 RepID=A0A5N5SRQ6_9CRUS|nr:hypothetical protein Anas_12989 [Armadillidium nasatum]
MCATKEFSQGRVWLIFQDMAIIKQLDSERDSSTEAVEELQIISKHWKNAKIHVKMKQLFKNP